MNLGNHLAQWFCVALTPGGSLSPRICPQRDGRDGESCDLQSILNPLGDPDAHAEVWELAVKAIYILPFLAHWESVKNSIAYNFG